MYELNTSSDFDINLVSYMLDRVNRQQFVTQTFHNKDYNLFCSESVKDENLDFVQSDFEDNELQAPVDEQIELEKDKNDIAKKLGIPPKNDLSQ